MKRLTTNDENHILASLNLFYCKDNEVWIRGGGPEPDYADCTLVDWIVSAAEKHHLDIFSRDAEGLGEEMYDSMQFGSDTIEGIVALLHAAAIQAAEMRGHLAAIEDILGKEYDLDRLRELAQADREGLVHIIQVPDPGAAVCGNCGNFIRNPGKRTGVCTEQSCYRNHRGNEEPWRGTFSPSQSRKACRKFVRAREEADHEVD